MHSEDEIKIGREIFVRSFFVTRPPPTLAQALVGAMKDHDYAAEDVIFEAGQRPVTVFFVVEGEVDLVGEDGLRWSFGEQSVIGIMDAVLDRPRVRRAVARTDAHLLSIRFQDYLELLEDHFDFAKGALEGAHQTIHETSRALPPDQVFKAPETTPIISESIVEHRPMNLLERLLVLHNAPMFKTAPVQSLVSLAVQAEEERWSEGEGVDAGQPSTVLRFVAVGRIRAEQPPIVGHFGPGDLVGAHAAIGHPGTIYRLTAEVDSVLVCVQKEDLYDLMEDHARLTQSAFAFAAQENERARSLLATIRAAASTDLEPTRPASQTDIAPRHAPPPAQASGR